MNTLQTTSVKPIWKYKLKEQRSGVP